MNNFDNNKPEEQGSTAEDFIQDPDEDLDYDREEPEELEEEICPDCGSNKMIRYTQQTSPDDYDWIYECLACGTTQST